MPEPKISVVTNADRLTQWEQLEAAIAQALKAQKPLRLRITAETYDYENRRGYNSVRDASWNLQLPSEGLTPDDLEAIIGAQQVFVKMLGERGAAGVMQLLEAGEGR